MPCEWSFARPPFLLRIGGVSSREAMEAWESTPARMPEGSAMAPLVLLLLFAVLAGDVWAQSGSEEVMLPRVTSQRLGPGVSRPAGAGDRRPAGEGRHEGVFHDLTYGDGLPDGTIHDILQDDDGNLWFATLNGATRYDGQEFTIYGERDGLCGDGIGALTQDAHGNLWFGCGGRFASATGISRHDGQTITTYSVEDGLAREKVWGLQPCSSGGVWVLTYSESDTYPDYRPVLQEMADGQIVTFDLGLEAVYAMAEAPDGWLWVGGDNAVLRLRGRVLQSIEVPGPTGRVRAITVDGEGAVWVGADSGAYRFDGRALKAVARDGIELQPYHEGWSNPVLSLSHDGQVTWIGTGNGGVVRYDGQRFEPFAEAEGLPDHQVGSLLVDRDGSLWCGTGGWNKAGNGVGRYVGDEITV